MGKSGNSNGDSTSDASSHPYFFKHRPHFGELREVKTEKEGMSKSFEEENPKQAAGNKLVGGLSNIVSEMSPTEMKDLVLRALVQSTASLVGSSSGVFHHGSEVVIGQSNMTAGDCRPTTTWKEEAYWKAEARRKRKPQTMRTSAGEDSDSQEEFPLSENATAEQRSLRTRRLNRSRARKAKDLTSNRKAMKKVPYVIHIDGSGKPRGIHKHVWKAAVRGQCGRLDASRDNINHHAKNVVDSLWHAIEKEWEFTGFAHKAREMFEKSATKYLRNRKMQLKYKCKNNLPTNDVHPAHWANIVDLTKKPKKESVTGGSSRKEIEGVHFSSEIVAKEVETASEVQGSEAVKLEKPSLMSAMVGETVTCEEDVDTQIKNLRSQLLWLESNRKEVVQEKEDIPVVFEDVLVHVIENKGSISELRGVADVMKENLKPTIQTAKEECNMKLGKVCTSENMKEDGVHSNVDKRKKSVSRILTDKVQQTLQDVSNLNTQEEKMEMSWRCRGLCGDVVSMTAIQKGKEEDVAKGVLMSFAGRKLTRKVIPKGWCSIQVSSYFVTQGSQPCPYPLGWKDLVKHKTVKEVEGRIILWPESLLHI